jgi:hypothetical protein
MQSCYKQLLLLLLLMVLLLSCEQAEWQSTLLHY